MCQEAIAPMTLIECYPIGVIKMTDQNETDEKIIAVPFGDPTLTDYHDISELPHHRFDEIRHFFTIYKELEGKQTAVESVCGREEAIRIIEECKERYNSLFKTSF
jgi:inorganic pyrophosphatase